VLHLFAFIVTLCIGALATVAPVRAQEEGCTARARLPWTAGGEGYFVEAIVSGPTCAHAVVLFLARGPGGMPPGMPSGKWPILPGNAMMKGDIGPVADIPTLASARDAVAMKAALLPWLAGRLRGLEVPKDPEDLEARRAAGETHGDCGARDTMPWPGAGPGYEVEVFSDGTDCNNAAIAMVVRAPGGRPLYSFATSSFAYTAYFTGPVATKDEMLKALRSWVSARELSDRTTGERFPEWPAGIAEGEMIRPSNPGGSTLNIDTGKRFDRESWNALLLAKRPAFTFRLGEHHIFVIVQMPDGSVIEAATIWTND
jgi:hypothetical protein